MSWCFCPLSSVFLLLPSLEIFRPFHARFIPIIGMDQTINKLMYSLHDLCHGLHYFPGGLLQRPLQVCNLFRTHEHSVISKVITQSLITQLSSLNVSDQIYVLLLCYCLCLKPKHDCRRSNINLALCCLDGQLWSLQWSATDRFINPIKIFGKPRHQVSSYIRCLYPCPHMSAR